MRNDRRRLEAQIASRNTPQKHAWRARIVLMSADGVGTSAIMAEARTAKTLTHDYKRNGTTTLFAALNVMTGEVFGRNMQYNRHQELIRFLNTPERDIPAGKLVHVVLDNYAAHKHEKVRAWLNRHPRWTFHFTPTSSSWLNAVEGFFPILTRRWLQNGVFHSFVDLQ